jgi:hypothetical protein
MVRVRDGLTFEVAFLSAVSNSLVLFQPSKMVGGEAISGAYQCNDATIKTNVTLPGGDIPYVGTQNCTFNAIHHNPETKAIPPRSTTSSIPRSKRSAPRSTISSILRSTRFTSYCATSLSPCWQCLRSPACSALSTSGTTVGACDWPRLSRPDAIAHSQTRSIVGYLSDISALLLIANADVAGRQCASITAGLGVQKQSATGTG